MPKNGHRRPLAAKPEVEIWRKPQKWTRSYRLPIPLPIHYRVYLDAIWHFTRESLPLRPCKQASHFEIFGDHVRKIVGGEGVSKCVIFDVESIFRVPILSENFSHYTAPVGLGTFRRVKCPIRVFFIFEADLLEIFSGDFCHIFTHCTGVYPPSICEDSSKREVYISRKMRSTMTLFAVWRAKFAFFPFS